MYVAMPVLRKLSNIGGVSGSLNGCITVCSTPNAVCRGLLSVPSALVHHCFRFLDFGPVRRIRNLVTRVRGNHGPRRVGHVLTRRLVRHFRSTRTTTGTRGSTNGILTSNRLPISLPRIALRLRKRSTLFVARVLGRTRLTGGDSSTGSVMGHNMMGMSNSIISTNFDLASNRAIIVRTNGGTCTGIAITWMTITWIAVTWIAAAWARDNLEGGGY